MPIFSKLGALTSKPEQARLALGMIAIAALAVGFWQIRSSLDLTQLFTPSTSTQTTNETGQTDAQLQELQNKDSDGDGLSDYDEQYLFRTSPYLKDTDSDGYDDKTEIESGNDPNCPNGQTCLRQVPVSNGSQNQESASAEPTAEQIRAILRQQGATEEQLSQYDDATLLQLYREVAGEESATQPASDSSVTSPSDTSSTTPSTTSISEDQRQLLKQMTGAQLRDFLIQGGADKDLLAKFDDVTLKSIVTQSLGL